MKLANDKGCTVPELGISAEKIAELTEMVIVGAVSSTAVTTITLLSIGNDTFFEAM